MKLIVFETTSNFCRKIVRIGSQNNLTQINSLHTQKAKSSSAVECTSGGAVAAGSNPVFPTKQHEN